MKTVFSYVILITLAIKTPVVSSQRVNAMIETFA